MDPHKNIITDGIILPGITDPVPCQVLCDDGTFYAEDLHADTFFSNSNDSCLYQPAFVDAVDTVGIQIHIKGLPLFQHCFLSAGNNGTGFRVNTPHNEVDLSAEHLTQQLILTGNKLFVSFTGYTRIGLDHHFLQRNHNTETLVIHNDDGFIILHLFNTAKLACENLAGAVGIVDLVPNNIVTVTLCFYITPYLKGQNGGVGCSCGRGTGNGWGRRQRSIVRFIEYRIQSIIIQHYRRFSCFLRIFRNRLLNSVRFVRSRFRFNLLFAACAFRLCGRRCRIFGYILCGYRICGRCISLVEEYGNIIFGGCRCSGNRFIEYSIFFGGGDGVFGKIVCFGHIGYQSSLLVLCHQ